MKAILVQAGHMPPLQPGHETQTGAPGEAELVAEIQHALVGLLAADSDFHPIPMPGRLDDGTQCDAAVFLHADGVDSPVPHGYCFGFPSFEVNEKLAHLIGEEFDKIPGHPVHRFDNPTKDASEYYGFAHTQTPGPEVLIEHGFVTNPAEHAWMKAHVSALAQAEHAAIRRFFGLATAGGSAHPQGTTQPQGGTGGVAPSAAISATTGLLSAPRATSGQAEQEARAAFSSCAVDTAAGDGLGFYPYITVWIAV